MIILYGAQKIKSCCVVCYTIFAAWMEYTDGTLFMYMKNTPANKSMLVGQSCKTHVTEPQNKPKSIFFNDDFVSQP
jgi:hypothetical protein